MKILMTTDAVGGVWTYSIELCRALAGHGVEVILATMGPSPDDEQRREAQRLGSVTLRESTFALEWMDNPWDDVAAAGSWLLDLEDEFSPDVVHLDGYVHANLPWRVPVMVVGHSCVLSWWQAVKNETAPALYKSYRRAVANGLHAADVVVAPSHAMLEALKTHYAPLPKSLVISNARDAAGFTSREKDQLVMTAGRLWDGAKNILAMAAIAGRIDWPIFIAGDERDSPGGDGLHRMGRLSSQQMSEQLSRAAIYALPARYEPFGLSVLEAALSGCALVLGDIPSLRENWTGAAAFADPDDHDALAAAIQRLIHDPQRRRSLAGLAMQRAQAFSPQRMVEEYLAAYHSILPAPAAIPATADHRAPSLHG